MFTSPLARFASRPRYNGSRAGARAAAWAAAAALVQSCASAPQPSAGLIPPAEAISLLGDTLRRPPIAAEARARMERQLADARAAAAANPNDPDALIWVGRRTAYLGRYNEAIGVFTEGIRAFPSDARMYRHRGHRYISVRRFDDAVTDLRTAASLVAGRPDEVEPDGQPNDRGVPIGSLHSNIWYHLALAYYLKGDWANVVNAARSGLDVSSNPDRLVSQTHWLYMALRRAGLESDALAVLAPIRDDLDVIENHSYYRLVKLYKTGATPAAVDSALDASVGSASDASFAYGLANWLLSGGERARAIRALEQIVKSGQWAAFGYIAAEADLARMRNTR